MRLVGLVAIPLLVGGLAGIARADDGFAALERSLPSGWTMLTTDTELVIRHDRPCFRTGEHQPNDPVPASPKGKGDGALVTLELRYHLEPRWTPAQHAEAKRANGAVAAEVKALRDRYRIDAIHVAKGSYTPANADERARVDAFQKAERAAQRMAVHEPMCALGDQSLFDGEETYAGMKHDIDPPEALKQAHAVVELVKKSCE